MAQDTKPVLSKKLEKTASLKKDMNFFSGFSKSSGSSTSYTTLFLILLLGFLLVGAGVYAVYFLQLQRTSQNVDTLKAEMATEEYQKNLAEYATLGGTLDAYNQQYYEVTNLYYQVSEMDKVESKYMDVIQANLPADVILTDFDYKDGSISLTGLSGSYYSPLALIANLSKTDTFTYVDITSINQLDLTTTVLTDAELQTAKQYSFLIKGSLEASYPVKVSKMIDGTMPTPLTAVTSTTYSVGETYKIDGINTFTNFNDVYTISRIKVNDVLIEDPDLFAAIQQADSMSGSVTSALNIVFYYSLSSTNGGGQG